MDELTGIGGFEEHALWADFERRRRADRVIRRQATAAAGLEVQQILAAVQRERAQARGGATSPVCQPARCDASLPQAHVLASPTPSVPTAVRSFPRRCPRQVAGLLSSSSAPALRGCGAELDVATPVSDATSPLLCTRVRLHQQAWISSPSEMNWAASLRCDCVNCSNRLQALRSAPASAPGSQRRDSILHAPVKVQSRELLLSEGQLEWQQHLRGDYSRVGACARFTPVLGASAATRRALGQRARSQEQEHQLEWQRQLRGDHSNANRFAATRRSASSASAPASGFQASTKHGLSQRPWRLEKEHQLEWQKQFRGGSSNVGLAAATCRSTSAPPPQEELAATKRGLGQRSRSCESALPLYAVAPSPHVPKPPGVPGPTPPAARSRVKPREIHGMYNSREAVSASLCNISYGKPSRGCEDGPVLGVNATRDGFGGSASAPQNYASHQPRGAEDGPRARIRAISESSGYPLAKAIPSAAPLRLRRHHSELSISGVPETMAWHHTSELPGLSTWHAAAQTPHTARSTAASAVVARSPRAPAEARASVATPPCRSGARCTFSIGGVSADCADASRHGVSQRAPTYFKLTPSAPSPSGPVTLSAEPLQAPPSPATSVVAPTPLRYRDGWSVGSPLTERSLSSPALMPVSMVPGRLWLHLDKELEGMVAADRNWLAAAQAVRAAVRGSACFDAAPLGEVDGILASSPLCNSARTLQEVIK